jgi:hypothetical protein
MLSKEMWLWQVGLKTLGSIVLFVIAKLELQVASLKLLMEQSQGNP